MPSIVIDPDELPSNSLIPKKKPQPQEEIPEPKIQKVTTGTVIVKKPNPVAAFFTTIFGEDSNRVGEYVIWDVLVPAAKNTISEMVSTGIEMLLFGETRGSSRVRRDRDRSYVPYNRYSRDDRDRDRDRERERDTRRERSRRDRGRPRFDDIIIGRREEAEEVLERLTRALDEYETVSVADLYNALDIQSDHSDHKYGWTNLDRAFVERVAKGYILNLPPDRPLD